MKASTLGGLSTGFVIFLVLIWILVIIGWGKNIIKIAGLWSEALTTEIVVRIIGIPFVPIGSIAGWF